ncbi:MAG: hypothetical protein HRT53_08770 [Colwellia sp.]|nr:hypothetical protein [Colwellia sp.]
MSTNHTGNNDKQTQKSTLQQQSNEAFIDELYDEVSQEQQSQPSELLDQRILSAAHKAINKSDKSKRNNHITWYSMLATAASITLVVSLVVLQQANILPNEQADIILKKDLILKNPINAVSDIESFSVQEVIAEQIDYQEEASYSARSGQMANSVANNTKVAVNERTLRAMQYKQHSQLAKQKPVAQMVTLAPVAGKFFAKIGPALEKKQTIMSLSIKQFQQYTLSNKTLDAKNQWLWSLHSENDMAYIINIYQDKQQSLPYRLDKNSFKIIAIHQNDSNELLLKNKALSMVIILNTNN